jgi:hypothetical protein
MRNSQSGPAEAPASHENSDGGPGRRARPWEATVGAPNQTVISRTIGNGFIVAALLLAAATLLGVI